LCPGSPDRLVSDDPIDEHSDLREVVLPPSYHASVPATREGYAPH
jgi:hypothetical protein